MCEKDGVVSFAVPLHKWRFHFQGKTKTRMASKETDQCAFSPNQKAPKNCSLSLSVSPYLNWEATTANGTYSDYHYDYDYSVSAHSLPLGELVPVAILYSITLILGVVGNMLVIFSILRYRRMQNVTNIFLTSLASADLLLVTLCVPIKVRIWFCCGKLKHFPKHQCSLAKWWDDCWFANSIFEGRIPRGIPPRYKQNTFWPISCTEEKTNSPLISQCCGPHSPTTSQAYSLPVPQSRQMPLFFPDIPNTEESDNALFCMPKILRETEKG